MLTLTEQKKQIEKIVPSGTSKEKNWSFRTNQNMIDIFLKLSFFTLYNSSSLYF